MSSKVEDEAVDSFIEKFWDACDTKIDSLRTEAYKMMESTESKERNQLGSRLLQMSNDIENAKRMVIRFREDNTIEFGGL